MEAMPVADRAPVVLCVDDEPSILKALRRVFLDEDFELLVAGSGDEGLEVVRERDVDLILSDFRMPNMDGVEFLSRVKELQSESMRIVLSGYADIKLIVTALNEGEIYRFISKPWNDNELRDIVHKALSHQSLNRENRRLAEELREFNAVLEQKVLDRTRELTEKNRSLRFARVILELLPMPVLGVNPEGNVVFANAQAREILEEPGYPLVDRPAPAIFEPELTGTLRRAAVTKDYGDHVMPMVIDGEPIGAIILTPDNDALDLDPQRPRPAFSWSVTP